MSAWSFLIPVAIGLSAVALAGIVAVRNRTIFSPHLVLQFRLPVAFGQKLPRWAKRQPVALFVLNEHHAHSTVHLPIHVENRSRRKLTDVSLQLVYPRRFFVHNRSHSQTFDEVLSHFPEKQDDIDSIKSLLQHRDARVAGEMVFVTIDIGTLRPGQSTTFYELLSFPSRELCFEDERFEQRMFGDIMERLKDFELLRGICHVQATLLSDLNKPKRMRINVVSAKGSLTETNAEALTDALVTPYAAAHWLGEYPTGHYFGPRLPFPRNYRQPFSRRETIDIMYPNLTYDVRKLSEIAVAASWFDGLGSGFGYGFARLPGYDYFDLPRGITRDQALITIGYGRVPLTGKRKDPARH